LTPRAPFVTLIVMRQRLFAAFFAIVALWAVMLVVTPPQGRFALDPDAIRVRYQASVPQGALPDAAHAGWPGYVLAPVERVALPGARVLVLVPPFIVTVTPAPPPIALTGGEVVAGPADRAEVALTFDAGAGNEHTEEILDILRAAGVRATMFLTGQWAEANPLLVRRIVADGHELANHSYSHPDFTALSADGMLAELDGAEWAVWRIAGTSTRPFWRPPYGARDARVLSVVSGAGYVPVYWTLDSGDWQETVTAAQVLARVSTQSQSGSIVVSHLNSWQTAQVLSVEIDQLRARGYDLVTLDEMFGR
jgi:peptidoglycan/xylan/chitin deacetylase (PgdA/CDA1 family)